MEFEFRLPEWTAGYVVWGIALLALLVLLIRNRPPLAPQQKVRSERLWVRFPFLLLASASLTQTFLLRLNVPGTDDLAPPGIEALQAPALAVFGAIPWMLAGGVLDVRRAVMVGLTAGFVRGAFQTHSILTPLLLGLQAGMVAWMLRRDHAGLQGRLVRSPLFSGLVSVAVFSFARLFEIFAHTQGDLYTGFDIMLSLAGPNVLAMTIEVGIGGAFCEWVKRQWADLWYQPTRQVIGRVSRSLAARLSVIFLLSGLLASSVILLGDWFSAVDSAREMITEQMRQTASQSHGSIPFFVRTGRAFSRQLADDLLEQLDRGSLADLPLEALLHSFTFFDSLEVYDDESQLLIAYPESQDAAGAHSQAFQADLAAALRGVPSETLERGSEVDASTKMAFITPINLPDRQDPAGVVVGWSDLASNLMLSPLIESFQEFSHGSAFVTNELGEVLIHSSSGVRPSEFDLRTANVGEVSVEYSRDGSRRLIYVEAIEEYSWHVVVTAPLSEVHRRAIQITLRLGGLLGVVGVVLLCSVYVISHRLTHPLRVMANMAQSIARGNLDQPVPTVGEDEIGQFASSFERMRRGLKARLEEMGLLLDVSQRLSSSFELAQILPPILEGVREIASADLARVALARSEKGAAPQCFWAGEDPGNWSALDRQILDLSEARGRFTLENPTRARAVLELKELSEPLEALTALPMRHEDAFVGVLWLGHRAPYAFSADALNLLSILCGQLAVAIMNAGLYQRAERERMRLGAVLESTPDAVMMIDSGGRISLLNPAAERLLDVSQRDAVGKYVHDVVANPDLRAMLLDAQGGDHAAEVEMGSGRIMFASVSQIQSEETGTSGRVCVLWDVSHYKRLDALKSEFVSTVSQDLRAPLTLMRGYATMLSMVGDVNEQQDEFLRKILTSIDHMTKLVDNLLDLGRIEAGMGLSISSVRIEPLIEELVESYRPQAVNKRVGIEIDMAEGMQPIEADPTLLRQAISNLVDNALKYTPADGHVTLHAEQRDGHQLISVTDTGVGIAPTDRARLFEKFYRVGGSDSLREQGLGLGLAIVKSIVEQHNGRILVESKLGQGSTFTLLLPLAYSGADLAEAAATR